jgi:geranylgeranyl reductase family protein
MHHFDVAIVGAGPAGSSTAIFLARRGYSVALIDKARFPREKLCGDFLNPANWPMLYELDLTRAIFSYDHEKVTKFRITSYSGAEAEVPLSSRNGEALFGAGLCRSLLDHTLLQKAVSEHVVVRQEARVTGLRRDTEGWFLEFDDANGVGRLHSKIVIGADGRNSWVAHRLGMADGGSMQARSVAFQLRLKWPGGLAGKVEIHLFPGGYVGLVGVGGDSVNLCLAVDKDRLRHHRSFERLMESCVALNPHCKEILRRSQCIGAMRSTYPVYFSPRRSYGERVLLVGDAARVTEPVTGEGIYFALKSGALAAEAVDQAFRESDFSPERLGFYQLNCRLAFRRRWRLNALFRWLIYRPAVLSPIIRFSGRRKRLLDSIVCMTCEPETAR